MASLAPLLDLIRRTYDGPVSIETVDRTWEGGATLLSAMPENPVDLIEVEPASPPWRTKLVCASRLPETSIMIFYEHADGSNATVVLHYGKPTPVTDWERLAK